MAYFYNRSVPLTVLASQVCPKPLQLKYSFEFQIC